jgi:hypothetical protein
MIAPCGMNCEICLGHQRDKNKCDGCLITAGYKSKSCVNCSIRNCEFLEKTDSKFCYKCIKFPCARLKQLDKRYRLKYKMSMIENLHTIEKSGLELFVQSETERWKCPVCGKSICVHTGYCLQCKVPEN